MGGHGGRAAPPEETPETLAACFADAAPADDADALEWLAGGGFLIEGTGTHARL